jgi:hypothetical protein
LAEVVKNWAIDLRAFARSELPVDIIGAFSIDPVTEITTNFHPHLVHGQPLYLYGSQYPGGKIINYDAFTAAPAGTEGNVPRNFARGFPAWQLDFALRREFVFRERLRLQFRGEAFNLFNHPSFGQPSNAWYFGPYVAGCPGCGFGGATSTLNNNGGINPLYQIGGPRSFQLALKLLF